MIFAALLPLAFLVQDPLPKADPEVSRSSLRHHLEFLASDELKGRGTATPESARASAYIARSLERSGQGRDQGDPPVVLDQADRGHVQTAADDLRQKGRPDPRLGSP